MLKRLYFIVAYGASWLVFGGLAVLLNFYGAVMILLRGRETGGAAVRVGIKNILTGWLHWLRLTGLVRVSWEGLDAGDVAPGKKVCVANHPGLLDAMFLLSRLPDAVCAFKPAMLRNPILAPIALMGGHPWCGTGPDFIRESVRQIAAGRTFLIFPEGTRTSASEVLNPLQPGFALIAARARVPVQVIVIHSSRDLLPRGRPWWSVPHFPATVTIRADLCVPAPSGQARETAGVVETRLRACLA